MSNNEHPITPPPELVQQWMTEIWHEGTPVRVAASDLHIATQAARWGADQELEACCAWLERNNQWAHCDIDEFHDARRPKPPSLKEQALAQTDAILNDPSRVLLTEVRETLELNRRALEALDD